jgi:predicted metalloprotease with PDZ domain
MSRLLLSALYLSLALGTGSPLPTIAATPTPITIEVDASEAPRRVLHARLSVPVEPGQVKLHYPQWIPGEHGPTGPITDLVGLEITAAGRNLAWERDSLDIYSFRVEVPEGAEEIEISLDYLVPSTTGRFTAGPSTSAKTAVMSWNTVLVYPAGKSVDQLFFRPSLRLAPGWRFGTALEVARDEGDEVEFETVSLQTLVDSPVAMGSHYRVYELTGEAPVAHRLHVVADSAEALEVPGETLASFRRLVDEGLALFGAYHYRKYDFLLTLSDHVTSFGLEHHESSDNRLPERALLDPDIRVSRAGLLPHEFVHSWNAKYRRPVGLTRSDFQRPFVDDLLWVYEGLTSYLGRVLTARSGLWSPEHARDALALLAAGLEHRPGRTWRALSDTARAAQVLFGAGDAWSSWRRGVDFYDEGVLIWLEADTTLRALTDGRRTLDDFCNRFHGGTSGPPEIKTFTYEELVAALNEIAPYDWRAFFDQRVYEVREQAPLGGITNGGWRLVFSEDANLHQQATERARDLTDLRFSLGLTLRHRQRDATNGELLDVIPGLPAEQSGLAPGMKLIAVNGRRWSPRLLRSALAAAKENGDPIELLIEDGDFFQTVRIRYRGGERYPHLVRDESQPDLLSDIFRALNPRTSGGN